MRCRLFDSWVGCLGTDDYRRFVLPHTKAVIDGLPPGVPVINFATGNPALVPLQAEAGGSVIGVDWRVRLDDAWRAIGHDRAIQGNLDPAALLADRSELRRRAKEVLDQAAGRVGHIFNLGHGILPQTPVDNAIALIEFVHELSASAYGGSIMKWRMAILLLCANIAAARGEDFARPTTVKEPEFWSWVSLIRHFSVAACCNAVPAADRPFLQCSTCRLKLRLSSLACCKAFGESARSLPPLSWSG